MQVFKDKTGRDWTIEINAGEIIRIRAESDGRFDLYDPGKEFAPKETLAGVLASDLPTCWEALWFVCSPAAKAQNMTAADFGRDLADDCLLTAQRKLLEEWRDFFHRLHRQDISYLQHRMLRLHLLRGLLRPFKRRTLSVDHLHHHHLL